MLEVSESNLNPSDRIIYRCPYDCGKNYMVEGNLKIHIKLHTGDLSYTCHTCLINVVSLRALNNHEKRVHPNDNIIICNVEKCRKYFKNKNRFEDHLLKHNELREFKCKFCGKIFTESGNLKVHERIHLGKKPFKCNVVECNSSFTSQGNLINHINSHFGIKPYKCQTCCKNFSRSYILKKHQECHLISRFNCDFCEKNFKKNLNLKKHILTRHVNFSAKSDNTSISGQLNSEIDYKYNMYNIDKISIERDLDENLNNNLGRNDNDEDDDKTITVDDD